LGYDGSEMKKAIPVGGSKKKEQIKAPAN